jgi:hypothetical protein
MLVEHLTFVLTVCTAQVSTSGKLVNSTSACLNRMFQHLPSL